MSPEAQRIAIAESCGWRVNSDVPTDLRGWKHEGIGTLYCDIPDYLNDLNAMHEAENWLLANCFNGDTDLWAIYRNRLRNDIHATAIQRAEVFLKTIGEWNNDR